MDHYIHGSCYKHYEWWFNDQNIQGLTIGETVNKWSDFFLALTIDHGNENPYITTLLYVVIFTNNDE